LGGITSLIGWKFLLFCFSFSRFLSLLLLDPWLMAAELAFERAADF